MNNDDRLSSGLNIDMCIEQIESKMSDDIIMQQIYISLCAYKIEIEKLKEENEKLKEENKHIFANVNDDELLRSNAINYAEAQKYKQRIDKAIEFIKENSGYDEEIRSCCDDLLYSDCDNLIALLGGDE